MHDLVPQSCPQLQPSPLPYTPPRMQVLKWAFSNSAISPLKLADGLLVGLRPFAPNWCLHAPLTMLPQPSHPTFTFAHM